MNSRLPSLTALALWTTVAGAQANGPATQRAESLWQAGRPWHAAETLLAAAAREPSQDAHFVVQAARADLQARRYDRARGLLVGQPWVADYPDGAALAVLAEAEAHLAAPDSAAAHYAAASARAPAPLSLIFGARAARSFEAAGQPDSAARWYAAMRAQGLRSIEDRLRLRQARVTRDTAAAFVLLAGVPNVTPRELAAARAQILLAGGDSTAARQAYLAAGSELTAARLALAQGDSAAARETLYALFARAPESDDAAAGVTEAHTTLPPRTASERVALAKVQSLHGATPEARLLALRAVREGDSSGTTLLLVGDLQLAAGRLHDAAAAYRLAARDSSVTPLAVYRRARVLSRSGDPGALTALTGFAERFPDDTAAPTALYLAGDVLAERGDWAGAAAKFVELAGRYPADPRTSTARFRLAAWAEQRGLLDSAAAWYEAEITAGGPQRNAARYGLGRIERRRGDSLAADSLWRDLAREDSLGFFGLRARQALALNGPVFAVDSLPVVPAVQVAIARLDTLLLAGLDTDALNEVRAVVAHPPADQAELLSWSGGLSARGWGSAGVRLAWQAVARGAADARVWRAVYPFPEREAVEAEAREFGLDPFMLAGLVRQESTFDFEALSRAGARGLAQLLPGTAAVTARALDIAFYPDWITVPDLNLHLGAAHLAELLRRYGGRVEVAAAAYNAGTGPVDRWLTRSGAADPDVFIERIPYPETRSYVRGVLRNRELYRALYGVP